MEGTIRIGTSGWHYKHWMGTFYPKEVKTSGQLHYYKNAFDTVELNNPFYRLPSIETFANWRKAVPENFLFAVKASRFITHMKKLKDPAESTALFIKHASALEEKLGPILFQLPPNWELDYFRLEHFLQWLPKEYLYTFEFRNSTWYNERVFNLLKTNNIAFCIYELNRHLSPSEITANFIYIRLHGPEGKYQGSYSDQTLEEWAEKSIEWSKNGIQVFIYFDNDQEGYAAFNAKKLKELVDLKRAH